MVVLHVVLRQRTVILDAGLFHEVGGDGLLQKRIAHVLLID